MSIRTTAWILLAALALAAVLLFNYWASFQPSSTLVYLGIVLAVFGLANLAVPFRFLGILKRAAGGIILAAGVALALGALLWPAPTLRVTRHSTLIDQALPEYQFAEKHSIRIHARREQILQAVRESTWADMNSLHMLLKIRGIATRQPQGDDRAFSPDRRILDGFAASGYISAGSEYEIVLAGGADVRAKKPIQSTSLQQFTDYREPDAVKMAFDFYVEDSGTGWCTLTAETRVLALDDSGRGMAKYWRLIVPGSGLLRRQWLAGIKSRAEALPTP